jgi:hypothetical protein
MKSQVKITVIKKNAVRIYKTPVLEVKNLKQQAVREMAATVSDWVGEFTAASPQRAKTSIKLSLCLTSTNERQAFTT